MSNTHDFIFYQLCFHNLLNTIGDVKLYIKSSV